MTEEHLQDLEAKVARALELIEELPAEHKLDYGNRYVDPAERVYLARPALASLVAEVRRLQGELATFEAAAG